MTLKEDSATFYEKWPWHDESSWPELGPFQDGQRHGIHEALALLLLADDEVLFLNSHTGTIQVACNDVFVRGCSDYGKVHLYYKSEAFWALYDLVREHGGLGSIAWAVRQRKQRPLPSLVEALKQRGLWTDEMESFK